MSKTAPKPGALIWDLPTRLFHWALALLVFMAFLSEEHRGIHQRVGIALLTLVVFRLIWGVVGGCYARFSGFVRGPKTVLAYIAATRHANPPQPIGHNPAGGWMVVLLLLLILVQAGMGLFSTDLIAYVGPLGQLVSDDLAKKITSFHKITSKLILAAVVIHIAAIAFYSVWKKHNLVIPMLSGRRNDVSDDDLPPLTKRSPPLWRALLGAALAILVVATILSLGRLAV